MANTSILAAFERMWQHVVAALDNKSDSGHTHTNATLGQGVGYCSTAAATTAKVVSLSNYELKEGGIVTVEFVYGVPASATMNINSKGAQSIYYKGKAIESNVIKGGDRATFIYYSLRYHLISIDRWHKDITDLQSNDRKVGQKIVTANANYPLLLAQSSQTADTTGFTYFDSGVYLNPSTNKIYADIDGTATKAKQDASGNVITSTYMTKANPTGTGSFSLNRAASTTTGDYSFAEGYSTTASAKASHAEGEHTDATGYAAHAEGISTTASGQNSHAEGNWSTASALSAHAEGTYTVASGKQSHAEGQNSEATGVNSHAEGHHTLAAGDAQHAQGKYNIKDTANTYAHIVGNGTSDTSRSNAHTLDWDGNAWFAGSVTDGDGNKLTTYTLSKSGSKIVLTGSDGSTSMVDDATSSGSGGTDGMEREFQMTVGGMSTVTPNAPKTQMYVVDVEHRQYRYCKTFLVDWMQVYLHGSRSYLIDYDYSTQSNAFLNCSLTDSGLVSFEIEDAITNWEFSSIVGYY